MAEIGQPHFKNSNHMWLMTTIWDSSGLVREKIKMLVLVKIQWNSFKREIGLWRCFTRKKGAERKASITPKCVGSGMLGSPENEYLALSNRSKDFPGGWVVEPANAKDTRMWVCDFLIPGSGRSPRRRGGNGTASPVFCLGKFMDYREPGGLQKKSEDCLSDWTIMEARSGKVRRKQEQTGRGLSPVDSSAIVQATVSSDRKNWPSNQTNYYWRPCLLSSACTTLPWNSSFLDASAQLSG